MNTHLVQIHRNMRKYVLRPAPDQGRIPCSQKQHTVIMVVLGLALALTGCTATGRPPMPPAIVMPPPQEKVADVHNPGSLYDPDGANLLFADARARRVGDVVLVKVLETTLAKNKASTTADKDNSFEMGAEAF